LIQRALHGVFVIFVEINSENFLLISGRHLDGACTLNNGVSEGFLIET